MGRPPRNPPAEVCKAVALHPEPVVAAKDVNEKLGLSPDGALDRLQKLTNQGYFRSKDVGSSATVFWLTDKGREELNEVF